MTVANYFLDADVGDGLADLLAPKGHPTVTTKQASRLNAFDDEQLLIATDLGRLLITHDKDDFLLLHRAWRSFARRWGVQPEAHAEIIVVPQRREVPYIRTAAEIDTLIRGEKDLRGRFFRLDRRWGWSEES